MLQEKDLFKNFLVSVLFPSVPYSFQYTLIVSLQCSVKQK